MKQIKELKTELKIQIKHIVKMSEAGRRQWDMKQRFTRYPYVFKALRLPELTDGVPITELNTEKKLCDLVWRYCGAGTYMICIMTNKRNKGHRSFVTIAQVDLKELSDGGYSVKEFKIKPKWRRRFASFKRIVSWKENTN